MVFRRFFQIKTGKRGPTVFLLDAGEEKFSCFGIAGLPVAGGLREKKACLPKSTAGIVLTVAQDKSITLF